MANKVNNIRDLDFTSTYFDIFTTYCGWFEPLDKDHRGPNDKPVDFILADELGYRLTDVDENSKPDPTIYLTRMEGFVSGPHGAVDRYVKYGITVDFFELNLDEIVDRGKSMDVHGFQPKTWMRVYANGGSSHAALLELMKGLHEYKQDMVIFDEHHNNMYEALFE